MMAGLRWHRFLALARPDSELPVRRSELRAPRKPFSSARHVDREALTPHPELGAQVVRERLYVFVRPNATEDDLPSLSWVATMPAGTSHGPARPPRARAGSGGWASHAARAGIAQSAHPDRARIPHGVHICCVQVLLARTHKCQHARRRAAGHVRRVGDAPQSFVRVSRKRCAPC